MQNFTFTSFLIRLVAALLLVFATFNPSGHSYTHWVASVFPKLDAQQTVAGIILLITWVIFAVATFRSIGRVGVILIAVLFAALTWLAFSLGWLSLERKQAIGWIALVALAVTMAVGMSWSFINRRISGQVDIDTPEHH
jgi:Na+/melibiose symporter-like transporter